MPLADPPLALRPEIDWAPVRARWDERGWLVGHGTAVEWGPGRAGSRRLIAVTLGVLLDLDPADIGTGRDERRRPFPVDTRTGERIGVDVNLSHTEDLLVLGVSRAGRIGVDVERADRHIASGPSMLARLCHPDEHAAIAALPQPVRTDAIARLWVCKEAVAKADGRGLAMDLAALRVDAPPPGYRLSAARLPSTTASAGYWLAAALREELPR